MKFNDLKSLYANVSNSLIERNGMVADFNVLLTALMSCNTNSLFLGSREQSKGALFYIGPYICKNGVQIIDSFDLLLEAQDYAKQYPSTAEDSSTDKRFVQHVLTRLLNKMNSLMEVSDTQAAAALLGMDAGMCSDIFISYDANAYLQQILDEKKYGEGGYDSQDDESCNKLDNDEESMSSFIVPDEDDLSYSDNYCDNDNDENNEQSDSVIVEDLEREEADCPFELVSGLEKQGYTTKSLCPIYKVDEGKRLEAVPLPDLYRYRGKELSKLSRYEYRTQVKVEQKSKDDEEEMDGQNKPKRGRQKSKSFEFAKGFELHASHIQKLRMKICTVKLYGNPPPFPGKQPEDIKSIAYKKWRKKADRFGAYFLALFRPEEHLYEKGQVNNYMYTWEAFIQFQNDLKNGSYIDRMRFRTMEGYMFAWRSNARDRTILSNYRERNRTIWSKTERDSALSVSLTMHSLISHFPSHFSIPSFSY